MSVYLHKNLMPLNIDMIAERGIKGRITTYFSHMECLTEDEGDDLKEPKFVEGQVFNEHSFKHSFEYLTYDQWSDYVLSE